MTLGVWFPTIADASALGLPSPSLVPRRDTPNGSLDPCGGKVDFVSTREWDRFLAQVTTSIREEQLEKALEYMEVALHLLDDSDAPVDIGAHLDHAISRMREVRPGSTPDLQ